MSKTAQDILYARDICTRGLPVACSFALKTELLKDKLKEAELEVSFLEKVIALSFHIIRQISTYQEVLNQIRNRQELAPLLMINFLQNYNQIEYSSRENANFIRITVIDAIVFAIEEMVDTNTVSRQLAVVHENLKFLNNIRNSAIEMKTKTENLIQNINEKRKQKSLELFNSSFATTFKPIKRELSMDLDVNKSKKPRKSCLPQFSDEKIKSKEFLDNLVLLECFAEEFEEDF